MIVEIDKLSTKTLADGGGEVLLAFSFIISMFELCERGLELSEASGADRFDLLRDCTGATNDSESNISVSSISAAEAEAINSALWEGRFVYAAASALAISIVAVSKPVLDFATISDSQLPW